MRTPLGKVAHVGDRHPSFEVSPDVWCEGCHVLGILAPTLSPACLRQDLSADYSSLATTSSLGCSVFADAAFFDAPDFREREVEDLLVDLVGRDPPASIE